MKKYKTDLIRYYGNFSYKNLIKGLLLVPGFQYMFHLRNLQSRHKLDPVYWISFVFFVFLRFFYGFQIPIASKIGKGFYIGHYGTIVLNAGTVIGDNCNIAHNVTIGQTNRGSKMGGPIIGSKVWMGTGSVIVGKVSIGDNVLIAPNSYINFDVPSNSIVIGNPAIIYKSDSAVDEYIINIV